MRFVADGNIPAGTVSALEAAGRDVAWIRTRSPGRSDADVLLLAANEQRILLTFDKDFGESGRRVALPSACGIVLIRLFMRGPTDATQLAGVIQARHDWAGNFSVIEHGRVRMRPMEKIMDDARNKS